MNQSPPQQFDTSFTKFGTPDPIASGTPIRTWMVHNFILEPIRKCLGADPHLKTHFGTLGTSFTKCGTSFIKFGTSLIKFGTSDPIASRTPIQTWMVYNFILEPIRKCLGVNPHHGMHFETLCTSFPNFGTSDPTTSGTPI